MWRDRPHSPPTSTRRSPSTSAVSLAEALAYELGPHGIDVVASCAGATRTPGFIKLVAGRGGPRAMTPAAIARATLGALRRRGAIVPGGFNRFAQLLMSR